MKKITERVFDWQIAEETKTESERDLYQYAYRMIVNKILGFLFISIASIVTGTVREVLFFLLSFIPLRQYAGGYHLKTEKVCLIFSIFVMINAGLIIQEISRNMDLEVIILIWTVAVLLIVKLAPVECKNKPLSILEQKVYGKRCKVVLLIEIAVTVILYVCNMEVVALSFVVSHVLLMCSLIIGKVAI